jgi:hypothetical protein
MLGRVIPREGGYWHPVGFLRFPYRVLAVIKLDFLERFRLHVEASLKRDEWARRAIDLLEKGKGKDKAGMAAAKQAERWDAKVKALER